MLMDGYRTMHRFAAGLIEHGLQALERNRDVLASLSGTSFNPSSVNMAALQRPFPPAPALDLHNNAYVPEQYALPSRMSNSSNTDTFEPGTRLAAPDVGSSADTILA